MRIISPQFRDYYDCIQSYGQDDDMRYLRLPKTEKYSGGARLAHCKTGMYGRYNNSGTDVYQHWIGFCGRTYPILELWKPTEDQRKYIKTFERRHRTINGSLLPDKDRPTFCINIEDIDAWVEANCTDEGKQSYRGKKKDPWRWRRTDAPGQRRRFQEFFAECEQLKESSRDYFIDNNCPIWHVYHGEQETVVTYNACLSDVEFYRILDPYSTYQELSMYIGGMASPEKEIPEMDDETMASIKGFDKWSFRKMPTKNT